MNKYNIERPLVKINNLSFYIGQKCLIRDIGTNDKPLIINDVTRPDVVNQGQIVAVVGRSGGGKSTFFKLLTGMYTPTTGSILIPKHTKDHDEVDNLIPVKEGSVGFVQQSYPLSRNESVYSMMMDAVRMGKVPKKERKSLILKSLEDWGLLDQRRQARDQLSGGQKQRAAILEQLLCSHHFIVLDEPFSGLDPINVDKLKSYFLKISTIDEINTIFFSTHNLHLAVELADLIIVIGYEKDSKGKNIPGGTIVATYDLKEMGLAWEPYGEKHLQLKEELVNVIKNS